MLALFDFTLFAIVAVGGTQLLSASAPARICVEVGSGLHEASDEDSFSATE